jgi:hypothetical protein
MGMFRDLEDAYKRYLEQDWGTAANAETAEAVANQLDDNGLVAHGKAFRHFLAGADSSIAIEDLVPGRACFVGPSPPRGRPFGASWFDPRDLSFSILVPSTEDGNAWIATQPVRVWQFRPFLGVRRPREDSRVVLRPPDFLQASRFAKMDAAAFVVNVDADEAYEYAAFFEKSLVGQLELISAADFLNPREFDSVLPEGMSLWDPSQPSSDLRLAFNRRTFLARPERVLRAESRTGLFQRS